MHIISFQTKLGKPTKQTNKQTKTLNLLTPEPQKKNTLDIVFTGANQFTFSPREILYDLHGSLLCCKVWSRLFQCSERKKKIVSSFTLRLFKVKQ